MGRTGDRGWRARIRVCVALVACSIAPAAVLATESVLLPDGDLLTVWQVRQPVMISGTTGPATDGTAIGFSVAGYEGSISDVIGITRDPAQDAWPRLVIDPASGWPRLFWSRYDGYALRIAYARYEAGGWTDIRYLTYGPTNSLLPRVGLGREGAYLFWASWEGGNFLYAPIDLQEGRLQSYPRSLPLYSYPKSALVTDSDGDSSATDAPVVTGDCLSGGCDSTGYVEDSGGTTTGAMDVPIVTGATDSIWTVGGSSGCRSQVMVIPNPGQTTASVVRFTHGSVSSIAITSVPSPTPDSFGDSIARALLTSNCD